MSMSARAHRQAGVSLIEVLVALFVLAFGMLGIAGMQTMAVRTGNGWVLNGTKRYITNAPDAEMAVIMARTSKALGARRQL